VSTGLETAAGTEDAEELRYAVFGLALGREGALDREQRVVPGCLAITASAVVATLQVLPVPPLVAVQGTVTRNGVSTAVAASSSEMPLCRSVVRRLRTALSSPV
jgi:hypothetical protein